jgi:cobalt-zinc-cadmium efflux system outer membrane protein
MMRWQCGKLAARPALVTLLFCASVLDAGEIRLSLENAVRLAMERNLDLRAKREEVGLAEARMIQANLPLRHNPELEGDILNRRLKKPEEGFNKNLPGGGISLSQEFEIGGQPRHRREGAQKNLQKVRHEVNDFERNLRFRISEIFLKLLSAQARIAQAEQTVELRSRLHEATKTRVALGDIPEIQLVLSEFELNRAKSDLISLQREREEILSRLRTDLALEENEKVEVIGDLTPQPVMVALDHLLKAALEKRPDLAASESEKKVTEAEELLTRAERIPNVKFGVFYEKDEKDNIVGGRFSIPIPLFDRKQGELREALVRKTIAGINYLNLRQSTEKGIRSAYEKLTLSARDLSLYPEGTLKKFDDSLEVYLRAYKEGAIDLAEVILFQNQVIEARLKVIEALTNHNLSLAELKFQAGIE